ncbi:ankyrin-3-like [Achlya hypogyna]|uniref:Ankyrin-3-like n=1 Tax=Achlya hypogyna TaxID=1202772 RepID=A0A1V9YUR9_ACHHY|nr:ankyrin-3-like [Achlya hypogyna]
MEVVSYLVQGISVNCINESGETALHVAANAGHTGVLAVLLEANASIDVVNKAPESRNHHYVARLLREAQRNNQMTMGNELILAMHSSDEQQFSDLLPHCTGMTFEAGETPLHLAAKSNHITVLSALLEAKSIDVDFRDKLYNVELQTGATALLIAVSGGFDDAVNVLLEAGADVNQSDKRGETPLLVAARNGFAAIVSRLLDSDVVVVYPTKTGETALHAAAGAGNTDVVALLLPHIATVDIATKVHRQYTTN